MIEGFNALPEDAKSQTLARLSMQGRPQTPRPTPTALGEQEREEEPLDDLEETQPATRNGVNTEAKLEEEDWWGTVQWQDNVHVHTTKRQTCSHGTEGSIGLIRCDLSLISTPYCPLGLLLQVGQLPGCCLQRCARAHPLAVLLVQLLLGVLEGFSR